MTAVPYVKPLRCQCLSNLNHQVSQCKNFAETGNWGKNPRTGIVELCKICFQCLIDCTTISEFESEDEKIHSNWRSEDGV